MNATSSDVNKSEIIRSSLNGNIHDRKRILAVAQSKLQQLPLEKRRGVEITPADINQLFTRMRRNGTIENYLKGATTEPKQVPVPKTTESPKDDYTRDELLSAKQLFSSCGNSLVRVQSLVKLVAELLLSEK